MIKLIKNTIDKTEINNLTDWLGTDPQLTKGPLTVEFEKKWNDWLGTKYSVFVNSGSSANIAALYSLLISKKLKNKKIVVPAVSWATTVSPTIQLGFEPIMCDCDISNLGLDISHLKTIIKHENPGAIILVHVLGFPNYMDEIMKLCDENNILLIEDTCESTGSRYNNKLLGTFGNLSTFSFYYGHHMSTIEGGMISTDDEELYNILVSIRSHGWDRDLHITEQTRLRQLYNIDDFNAAYTFYYAGFNIRSTDLQAFIGIGQMDKLENIISNRHNNYKKYQDGIKNDYWKITDEKNVYVSNFAYPIISNKRDIIIKALNESSIECRPLICGSMNKQPFWYNQFGEQSLPNADIVHKHGLYLPNNHEMTDHEIETVINIVNTCI